MTYPFAVTEENIHILSAHPAPMPVPHKLVDPAARAKYVHKRVYQLVLSDGTTRYGCTECGHTEDNVYRARVHFSVHKDPTPSFVRECERAREMSVPVTLLLEREMADAFEADFERTAEIHIHPFDGFDDLFNTDVDTQDVLAVLADYPTLKRENEELLLANKQLQQQVDALQDRWDVVTAAVRAARG